MIVVGGGAAGLAARAAAEARGLSTILLEAQDRLGGRVHTVRDARDVPVDLGAQLINGDMTEVLALAQTSETWIAPLPVAGRTVVLRSGKVTDHADGDVIGPGGDFDPSAILQMRRDAPASDMIERFIRDRDERALATASIEELFGRPARELSAKGIADVASKYESGRGDGEFQLRDGFGPLLQGLVGRSDGTIRLQTPARELAVDAEGVVVAHDGGSLRARGAVIAVPPTVVRAIRFPEALRSQVLPLLDSYVAGDMIKVTLSYSVPFWRSSGLSGRMLAMGDVQFTAIDASRDDGSLPRLVVFVGGDSARRLVSLPFERRHDDLLSGLTEVFGPDAAVPEALTEGVWVDHPWCGGGYNAAIRAGGVWDAGDRLMALEGRVVFAGAECAPAFRGFVEGALRSGMATMERLSIM